MLFFSLCCIVALSSSVSGEESNGSSNIKIHVGQDCSKGGSPIAGPQGMPGFPGFPGLPGQKGELGVKGELGAKGDRGNIGLRGPYGIKGQKGATGASGSLSSSGGGVTYTRWGSTSCRSGASLVYAGRGGGAHYNQKGGGANFLCMPNDPQYTLSYRSGVQGYSKIEGLEYEHPLLSGSNNDVVSCAVCYITQQTTLMIPAKTTCPSGWTREYYGYLMASHAYHYRSEYVCVDSSMGHLVRSRNHGAVIYHVEAVCNGLACPPYDRNKELTCVVCTK